MTDKGRESKSAEVDELTRLRRRVRLLEWMLDNIPIMLFVKEAGELRFDIWNKGAEEIVGFRKDQLLGKNDYDLFPEEQAVHFQAKDRQVLDSGELLELEEPISTPNGDRVLYTKKIPLYDDDGKPLYLVGVSVDITERKRAEAALEKARRQAETASRAKSEFLANVSHELRTPLTLILGPLQALLHGEAGALASGVRERLERMGRNASRLAALVNDVLDLTKAEAGRMEVKWEPVDLGAEARALVDDAQSVADARGIALTIETSPSASAIPLDRRLFGKILMNLVSNALKFTPEKGRIEVGVEVVGDELAVSVADTGIGIPDEEGESIFQRFHQADASSTRKYEGTGLGLALVKDFTELMGGRITLTSKVGVGSKFTVFFPRSSDRIVSGPRSEPSDEAKLKLSAIEVGASPSVPPSAPPLEGERPRVVIAEDNADMRRYLIEVLGGEFDVVPATDGEHALRAIRESRPDVVVSDVMMPIMDGFELVRRLKTDEELKHVPVILVTARAGAEATASGLESGADDYLPKPFAPAELRARVRAALRLHRQSRDLALTLDELMNAKEQLVQLEKLSLAGKLASSFAARLAMPLEKLRARASDPASAGEVVHLLELVAALRRIGRATEETPQSSLDLSRELAVIVRELGQGAPPATFEGNTRGSALVAPEDLRFVVGELLAFLRQPRTSARRKGNAAIVVTVDRNEGRPLVLLRDPDLRIGADEMKAMLAPGLDHVTEDLSADIGLALAQQMLLRNGADLSVHKHGQGIELRIAFGG